MKERKTPDTKKKDDDAEKNTIARQALRQAVAALPTKPVEKLPMEYLKALPMIIGVGTFLLFFALVTYVPTLNSGAQRVGEHVSRKTGELVDYMSLSASLGVASVIETVDSFSYKRPHELANSNQKFAGRFGRDRMTERQTLQANTFAESVHLIIHSASALYGFDQVQEKLSTQEEPVTKEQPKPQKTTEGTTLYDVQTGKYSCQQFVRGEAVVKAGVCR